MGIRIRHPFVSLKAEGADPNKVRTSKWNEDHAITMDGGYFIGRATAGEGAAEQIPFTANGRGIINAENYAAMRSLLSALALSDVVGQNTIWVPAGALTPTTTNGSAPGKAELTTNKIMVSYLAFDAATVEKAQIMVLMPKSWNRGSIIAQFVGSQPAGSGNVVWGAKAVAFANDDGLDAAFGTVQTVTATGGTANDAYLSGETAGFTVAGSPGSEELVCFEFTREAADGSDTLTVDAWLIGVKLHYTTDAARDD